MNDRVCPIDAPGSTYDNGNRDHQSWLLWWLGQMGVAIDEQDEFGREMHGQPVAHFNVLARGYRIRKEREANGAQ